MHCHQEFESHQVLGFFLLRKSQKCVLLLGTSQRSKHSDYLWKVGLQLGANEQRMGKIKSWWRLEDRLYLCQILTRTWGLYPFEVADTDTDSDSVNLSLSLLSKPRFSRFEQNVASTPSSLTHLAVSWGRGQTLAKTFTSVPNRGFHRFFRN